MNSAPPIIAFELGVGDFRIVTPEAVYQIKVCPDLVEATRAGEAPGEAVVAPSEAIAPAEGAVDAFFQDLSQELFDKVGRLARRLSVSVEELPADMPSDALGDTDQQLENAKGQLEEIIDITEKASMSIMDSADEIQDHLTQLRDQMDILNGLNFIAGTEGEIEPPPQAEPSEAPDAGSVLADKAAEINALLDRLLERELVEAAPSPPPPAPAPSPVETPPTPAEMVTIIHFDVDVVFQTLYELCTNESVKDHIRLMRESQAASFDSQDISGKLTEMAPTVTVEDGFYNFPITAILKILYGAASSEDFRNILKKMNQTAASIFLDEVLPVEGEAMEVEAAAPAAPPAPEPEPEPAPAESAPLEEPVSSGSVPADLKTLRALTAELEDMARSGPAPAKGAGGDGLYTRIPAQDRDTMVGAVSQANELIHKIGRHLTRILETLSFQDLSGQRIKKVVAMMGDIQTQLLSILVSVDTKLKVHQARQDQAADPEKTERMAQDEVDKALEKLMPAGPAEMLGPGAENRLNQNAVNDLLSQLGF
jgi:chemotaxis regulatin CheY-phosphate phosphatase CheZ